MNLDEILPVVPASLSEEERTGWESARSRTGEMRATDPHALADEIEELLASTEDVGTETSHGRLRAFNEFVEALRQEPVEGSENAEEDAGEARTAAADDPKGAAMQLLSYVRLHGSPVVWEDFEESAAAPEESLAALEEALTEYGVLRFADSPEDNEGDTSKVYEVDGLALEEYAASGELPLGTLGKLARLADAKRASEEDVERKAEQIHSGGGVGFISVTVNSQANRATWEFDVRSTSGNNYPVYCDTELDDPKTFTSIQDRSCACFPPGTPVTMHDGTTRSIEEIVEGDRVLSHRGKVQRVSAVMCHEAERLHFVKVKGFGETIRATEEHPFLVKDDTGQVAWKPIERIKPGEFLSHTARAYKSEQIWLDMRIHCESYESTRHLIQPSRSISERFLGKVKAKGNHMRGPRRYPLKVGNPMPKWVEFDEEIAYLLGLYLGDGHIRRHKTKGNQGVGWHFGLQEDFLAERIQATLLKRFNLGSTKRRVKNTILVFASSKVIADFFEYLGGSARYGKRINGRLMHAKPTTLLRLVEGHYDADAGSSVNRSLISQMQSIFSSNRLTSTIRTATAEQQRSPLLNRQVAASGSESKTKDCYTLRGKWYRYADHRNASRIVIDNKRERHRHDSPTRYFEDDRQWTAVEAVGEAPYEGSVYNLEVEEDHSYQVFGFNCHNCAFSTWNFDRSPSFMHLAHRLCSHLSAVDRWLSQNADREVAAELSRAEPEEPPEIPEESAAEPSAESPQREPAAPEQSSPQRSPPQADPSGAEPAAPSTSSPPRGEPPAPTQAPEPEPEPVEEEPPAAAPPRYETQEELMKPRARLGEWMQPSLDDELFSEEELEAEEGIWGGDYDELSKEEELELEALFYDAHPEQDPPPGSDLRLFSRRRHTRLVRQARRGYTNMGVLPDGTVYDEPRPDPSSYGDVESFKAAANDWQKGYRKLYKRLKERERAELVKNAPGTFPLPAEEWAEVLKYHGERCYWCLGEPAEVGVLHQDHYLPVTRGGSNLSDNVVPSCGVCNSKHGNKTPEEFEEWIEAQTAKGDPHFTRHREPALAVATRYNWRAARNPSERESDAKNGTAFRRGDSPKGSKDSPDEGGGHDARGDGSAGLRRRPSGKPRPATRILRAGEGDGQEQHGGGLPPRITEADVLLFHSSYAARNDPYDAQAAGLAVSSANDPELDDYDAAAVLMLTLLNGDFGSITPELAYFSAVRLLQYQGHTAPSSAAVYALQQARTGTVETLSRWFRANTRSASLRTLAAHDDVEMIALVPPREVAEALALENGEDPEDLHVTLAVVPVPADATHLRDDVEEWARSQPQLTGRISGYGVFLNEDDSSVLYAGVDVPGITDAREDLAEMLESELYTEDVDAEHGARLAGSAATEVQYEHENTHSRRGGGEGSLRSNDVQRVFDLRQKSFAGEASSKGRRQDDIRLSCNLDTSSRADFRGASRSPHLSEQTLHQRESFEGVEGSRSLDVARGRAAPNSLQRSPNSLRQTESKRLGGVPSVSQRGSPPPQSKSEDPKEPRGSFTPHLTLRHEDEPIRELPDLPDDLPEEFPFDLVLTNGERWIEVPWGEEAVRG